MSELRDEEEVAAIVELKLECKSDPEATENPIAIASISISSSISIGVPYSEDG